MVRKAGARRGCSLKPAIAQDAAEYRDVGSIGKWSQCDLFDFALPIIIERQIVRLYGAVLQIEREGLAVGGHDSIRRG